MDTAIIIIYCKSINIGDMCVRLILWVGGGGCFLGGCFVAVFVVLWLGDEVKDLTCTIRTSCYSARLSCALILIWVSPFVQDK